MSTTPLPQPTISGTIYGPDAAPPIAAQTPPEGYGGAAANPYPFLNEGRKQQLDSIVQKMIGNKESDDNINAVVQDFKQKYSAGPPPSAAPSPDGPSDPGIPSALPQPPRMTPHEVEEKGQRYAALSQNQNPPMDWSLSSVGQGITDVAQGFAKPILHPIQTIEEQGAELDKAKAAWQAGDYVKAGMHALGYLTPVLGPGAADGAAQELDRYRAALDAGDYAGAATHGLALATPIVGPMAVQVGELAGSGHPGRALGQVLASVAADRAMPEAQKAVNAFATDPAGAMKTGAAKAGDALDKVVEAATSDTRDEFAGQLNRSADKNYETALNPTTRINKALTQEEVAPGLRERGVTATSLKNLQEQAQAQIEDLGSQIDEAFERHADAGTKVSARPILDRLQREKQSYIVDGVPINEAYINRVEGLQQQIKAVANQNGGSIPLASLRRIRQIHDQTIAQSKGGFALAPDDASSVAALKTYTDAIRSTVAEIDPELAALNKEFSFWKNVDQVAGASLLRKTGQRAPLTQKFGELLGGTLGGHVAGYGGGMIGAKIGGALGKLKNSTLWNTFSAQAKAKIANLLAAGDDAGAAQQFVQEIEQSAQQYRSTPGLTPQEMEAHNPPVEAPRNPASYPAATQVIGPKRLPANVTWRSSKTSPAPAGLAKNSENVSASGDVTRRGDSSDLRNAEAGGRGRVPDAGGSHEPVGPNETSGGAGPDGGVKPKSGAQLEAERLMAEAKRRAQASQSETKPIGEMARVPELSGKRDEEFRPNASTRFHIARSRFDPFELDKEDSDVAPHASVGVANVHLMEFLGRAVGRPLDDAGVHVGAFRFGPDQLERVAAGIEDQANAFHAEGTPIIRQLQEVISEAKGKGQSVVSVRDHASMPPELRQALLDQELNHVRQGLLGPTERHLGSSAERFVGSRVGTKAKDALEQERGYPFGKNVNLAALEIGERLMRPDAYRELGLSGAERDLLADQYMQSLEKEYGEKAKAVIERIRNAKSARPRS